MKIKLDRSDRCLECRKPIARSDAGAYRWTSPGGPGVNDSRRTYSYARHAACQAEVEQQVEESRQRAEVRRAEELRALAAILGVPLP